MRTDYDDCTWTRDHDRGGYIEPVFLVLPQARCSKRQGKGIRRSSIATKANLFLVLGRSFDSHTFALPIIMRLNVLAISAVLVYGSSFVLAAPVAVDSDLAVRETEDLIVRDYVELEARVCFVHNELIEINSALYRDISAGKEEEEEDVEESVEKKWISPPNPYQQRRKNPVLVVLIHLRYNR